MKIINRQYSPKLGDLKVWHIPQVPGQSFDISVETPKEGQELLDVLAMYDLFQFEENIKPDYCNASGLSIFEDWGDEMGWGDYDWGYHPFQESLDTAKEED